MDNANQQPTIKMHIYDTIQPKYETSHTIYAL